MIPRWLYPIAPLLFAASMAAADPPGRVGRISLIAGTVSLQRAQTGEWEAAALNWPVTGGDAIETWGGARAELRIGSTALRLDGDTELEFVRLDDDAIRVRLVRGSLYARIRSGEIAREFELSTAHDLAWPLAPGRYRFEADSGAISYIAYAGSLGVDSGGSSMTVHAGERAEFAGAGSPGYLLADAGADEFLDWNLARDRRDDAMRAARNVSSEMTGREDLEEYGNWQDHVEYGPVWVPRVVPAGWAPYRYGRWVPVAPWGWTWIDDAPWGFAPFHYGRWVLLRRGWGWVPGSWVARPVYAPALVGWVGQPGWSISIGIGSTPALGWFPLAPREAFHPPYRSSTDYVRRINRTHVNVIVTERHAGSPRPKPRYRDELRAVTVVPAEALTKGLPVQRAQATITDRRMLAEQPAASAPHLAPPLQPARTPAAGILPRFVPGARGEPMRPERPAATPAARGAQAPRDRREPAGRAPSTPAASMPPSAPAAIVPAPVQGARPTQPIEVRRRAPTPAGSAAPAARDRVSPAQGATGRAAEDRARQDRGPQHPPAAEQRRERVTEIQGRRPRVSPSSPPSRGRGARPDAPAPDESAGARPRGRGEVAASDRRAADAPRQKKDEARRSGGQAIREAAQPSAR